MISVYAYLVLPHIDKKCNPKALEHKNSIPPSIYSKLRSQGPDGVEVLHKIRHLVDHVYV